MNLIERIHAWWAYRNLTNNFEPTQCSIHAGDTLTRIHKFWIEDDDAISVAINYLGVITSASVEVPAGTPRGVKITNIADNRAVFIRISNAGTPQWLRMNSWGIRYGKLTAHFSREYNSRRWSELHGYYFEQLIEPSPPVPFGNRHPHYEGSAQQHLDRGGVA